MNDQATLASRQAHNDVVNNRMTGHTFIGVASAGGLEQGDFGAKSESGLPGRRRGRGALAVQTLLQLQGATFSSERDALRRRHLLDDWQLRDQFGVVHCSSLAHLPPFLHIISSIR